VAGLQVRLATSSTGEDYVTGRLWERATITSCPWHPEGHCGLRRHGTYERVTPPGCLVARWYCPLTGRTVSALPDCLAAHRRGTLAELEEHVLAVEQTASLEHAAGTRRTEIELPGALRYLGRLARDVHRALAVLRGLDPERFIGCAPTLAAFVALLGVRPVLVGLRGDYAAHLPGLAAPLGFDPRRNGRHDTAGAYQHRSGRDPPHALIEARVLIHKRRPRHREHPHRLRSR